MMYPGPAGLITDEQGMKAQAERLDMHYEQVAAAEMDEKEWHMSGQSADWASAQQLHTDHDLSISGVDNIHGPAISGGYWAAPKLLPVSEVAASIATLHGSMPRKLFSSFGEGFSLEF